jgi:integrase
VAIIRKPLKTDTSGKCTRWRLLIYNPASGRRESVTFRGALKDAQAFERELKNKIARKTFVTRSERLTVGQLGSRMLEECRARGRRTSTLLNYESVFRLYVVPEFGVREVGTLQKKELRAWFTQLLAEGHSVALVNRVIRAFKTLLFYAMDELEVLDRNVLMRFKQFKRSGDSKDRKVNRGTYTEEEVRALLAHARPNERALIGLLCLTGIRPGEVYALRERDVDFQTQAVRIERNWDWRGKIFTAPKTDKGRRTLALSDWLIFVLRGYLKTRPCDPEALLFSTRTGQPVNPSNVRRDIWVKLVARANVRKLDMYSLRHTFASLGRASGEEAFNVARAMGHSRSQIVDDVYAHALPSGMTSVAARVTARALGQQIKPRLVSSNEHNERDVTRSLPVSPEEPSDEAASG